MSISSTQFNGYIDLFNTFMAQQYELMYPTDENRLTEISAAESIQLCNNKYKSIRNNSYYIISGAYRLIKQRITTYLGILSSIDWQTTWNTQTQHTLYRYTMLLLSHNTTDIQKSALTVLLQCNHIRSSLNAYQHTLYRIIDDTTIRDELTLFSIDTVHSKHRQIVIFVITRILLSKLLAKNTKNALKNKIVSFYSTMQSSEIEYMIQCILIPFHSIISYNTYNSNNTFEYDINDYTGQHLLYTNQLDNTLYTHKQQLIDTVINNKIQLHMSNNRKIGFLRLLEIIMKNLRLSIVEYIQYILPVLLWLYKYSDDRRQVLQTQLNSSTVDDSVEPVNTDAVDTDIDIDTDTQSESVEPNDQRELRESEQICNLCLSHYTFLLNLYPQFFTTDTTFLLTLQPTVQHTEYIHTVY